MLGIILNVNARSTVSCSSNTTGCHSGAGKIFDPLVSLSVWRLDIIWVSNVQQVSMLWRSPGFQLRHPLRAFFMMWKAGIFWYKSKLDRLSKPNLSISWVADRFVLHFRRIPNCKQHGEDESLQDLGIQRHLSVATLATSWKENIGLRKLHACHVGH